MDNNRYPKAAGSSQAVKSEYAKHRTSAAWLFSMYSQMALYSGPQTETKREQRWLLADAFLAAHAEAYREMLRYRRNGVDGVSGKSETFSVTIHSRPKLWASK